MTDTTDMVRVVANTGPHAAQTISSRLVLSYDQRVKGRLLTHDDSGREIGLFLERGKTLRHGDCLETEQGEYVLVVAQEEQLLEANCDDWLQFARAVYHLGNRHVAVDIAECRLRIQPDAILEDMLVGLGLRTQTVTAPFNPESGAYSKGHHHHHDNDHGH